MIDPVQLVHVESRGRGIDVRDVEPRHQLLAREDFVVAVRPAQAGEEIDHRLGEKPFLRVMHDADRAMTLGQLGSIGAQNRRQVSVDRRLGAERADHVDLARSVVDVVVAADDVGDLHVEIVDDHAEIVGWACRRCGR